MLSKQRRLYLAVDLFVLVVVLLATGVSAYYRSIPPTPTIKTQIEVPVEPTPPPPPTPPPVTPPPPPTTPVADAGKGGVDTLILVMGLVGFSGLVWIMWAQWSPQIPETPQKTRKTSQSRRESVQQSVGAGAFEPKSQFEQKLESYSEQSAAITQHALAHARQRRPLSSTKNAP